MNRLGRRCQLTLLDREVHRLICNNVEESAIYTNVNKDERFNSIGQLDIKNAYEKLIKEGLKNEMEVCICRSIKSPYFIGPIKMPTANYALGYVTFKWSDRFFIVLDRRNSNLTTHEFYLLDLFNNSTRTGSFQKAKDHVKDISRLDGNFGLVLEYTDKNVIEKEFVVSLVCFDVEHSCFHFLKTYQNNRLEMPIVCVDVTDPSKFIIISISFNGRDCIIPGSREHNQLIFEAPYEFDHSRYTVYGYHSDCLYSFMLDIIFIGEAATLLQSRNLKNDVRESVEVNNKCGLFECKEFGNSYVQWIKDRVYVTVYFKNCNTCGIAWASTKSPVWTLIDFSIDFPIFKLKLVNHSDLLIRSRVSLNDDANERRRSQQRFYKISFGKPDVLRNLAWFQVVRTMKKLKTDPYKLARSYRPLNF